MCYFSAHNHTSYSNASRGFPDSINMVKPLVDHAIEIGLTGLAITEHECLSSHFKLLSYRDELEAKGKINHDNFTVALGDEIYLTENLEMGQRYYHHLLIAKTAKGHKILRKISSQAWENSFYDRGLVRTPITREQLAQIMKEEDGKGHLISSTACIGSFEAQAFLKIKNYEESRIVDKAKVEEEKQKIVDFVEWNISVFGKDDFYLEIAPNSSEEQRYVNKRTWALGQAMNVPVIFTTDSHYLSEEDREIHKAYLNSKEAEREVDDFYWTAYMMEEDKVKKYMTLDFSEDEYEEMLNNLEKIRSRIEHYSLKHEQEIPRVPVEVPKLFKEFHFRDIKQYKHLVSLLSSQEEQNQYWISTCLNELHKRDKFNAKYLNQLDIEARTLIKISERLKQPMASYYNTAKKIVELIWTEGDSLVGISRGSALGFVSNWLLDITQIDPLEYFGDLSWRHLSESRPELPDVDVDSQGSKREQVLKAMQNFFGADRVLNIATFGTEKAKSALATAARGLGIPDDVSSYLSGLIVNERGFDKSLHETVYGDIDKGVKPNKPFVEEINKYPNYLETALAIEGLIKSRGSHASGQYYYTHDYTDINAMMKTPTGTKVTQWEYHDSDAMGSLKFDMLAIESLDKIRATMDLLLEDKRMEWQGDLKSTYDKYLHPKNLDYSKEMWKPTWENKVLDVFQLDTAVGKQAMRNAKPKDLKEVADLNSLMRLMAQPGQELPLDKYVRFKQNIQLWYEEMDNVGVPKVEVPILEKHYLPSYGVPNAQEQLMLLVMDKDVCGLSESEANMIRKVIGKKQMSKIPEVKDLVFSNSKLSMESTNYLWKTAIETQLG